CARRGGYYYGSSPYYFDYW
nr:immunoglobulin heavy chain junction region [Mus musculus]MBK4196486.1 immunoglobulin heavy chain junction region [Mus musculus]MBK4196487.1 immunoglobulin heavy chain junction region [Mus musculus]MBK4196489.1 immunoglobulin heavy chain junction region [Mus musculus]MBK4196490.1 immunoglobulin heavy chain junction region [Mus musculus]